MKRKMQQQGQALTEFALTAPLLIIICLAIIQFMHWTRVMIETQNGAWYAVRSQTQDYFTEWNFPVNANQLMDSLNSSIFPFYSTDRLNSVSVSIDNNIPAQLALAGVDILNPIDISMIRQSTVVADTQFLPEAGPYPPMNYIFGRQLVTLNGKPYLQATAQSSIFASWTSFAQNPGFNENAAKNNYNNKDDCSQLQNGLSYAQSQVSYYQNRFDRYEQLEKEEPDNRIWQQEANEAQNELDNWQNNESQLSNELNQLDCNNTPPQ